MNNSIIPISHLVQNQFPQFYKEHGPAFIDFVRAYYEWLEESGNILGESRSLYTNFDIDTTADEFLRHFKEKYVAGIPDDILGNYRFLQKHILDLYNSKGSEESIRLLFRLLFNEDIDIYVPHYDIFKTSDNTWIEPRYIEVSNSPHLDLLNNMYIWGGSSGASAIVEAVERKNINDILINTLFVSNVSGEFEIGEPIYHNGMPSSPAPRVLGSPTSFSVLSSSSDFKVGDIIYDSSSNAIPLRGVVTDTYESFGIIVFDIVDGGSYYSLDAEVEITTGANTTGFGADFIVSDISNPTPFTYSVDKLLPYAGVALNAPTYGFPTNPDANANTIIAESLEIITTNVGTISRIITLNPGTGYDDYVNVKVIDPHTSTRFIPSHNGFGGTDAIITGEALSGQGLISEIRVYDSSYGYNTPNQIIQFSDETGTLNALAQVNLGGIGHHPGFFDNNNSFTSDVKYLFDGHYYQDFAYEIQTNRSLESYIDILKQLVHMGGNAVFGKYKTLSDNSFRFKCISDEMIIKEWILKSDNWNDSGIWMDHNYEVLP